MVSVIVPVYNIENYISRCVESVLAQTSDDYEIILVDDGSKDNSGHICDEYATKYPDKVIVVHKENGGLSDARNAGIQIAKGDYLLFVDGDDYISANAIESISKYTYLSPDVILSRCIFRVDENGVIKCNIEYNANDFSGITGEAALLMTSKHGANWSACAKAFKTSYWKENEFHFLKGRNWEDFQLIDKVILGANTVYMIDGFYYYYVRTDSITKTVKARDIRGLLSSFDEWDTFFLENKFSDDLVKNVRNLHARLFCATVMGYIFGVSKDDRTELLTEAKKRRKILDFGTSKDVIAVRLASLVLGFECICRLLYFSKKIRKIV